MEIFIYIVILLFSIIIHEVAHAYVADKRGDNTARLAGRITLNPIPHIDLLGSIILPLTLVLFDTGIVFGWAKPVPVNTLRLKNPKTDIPLVSLAGPLSNILLAIIAGILIRIVRLFPDFGGEMGVAIQILLSVVVMVNIVLLVINMIPIPPLDGSKVLTWFMPRDLAEKYLNINPFLALAILFVLLATGIVWRLVGPIINFLIVIIIGQPI